jgi:hypothetical protein
MYDQPTATELLAAARAHLEQHVVAALSDQRLRFQTLVAANVLAIVERELALADARLAAAWCRMAALEGAVDAVPPAGPALRAAVEAQTQRMCERIRAGAYDQDAARGALLAHLRQTAIEELEVSNPRYLERLAIQPTSAQPTSG